MRSFEILYKERQYLNFIVFTGYFIDQLSSLSVSINCENNKKKEKKTSTRPQNGIL